MNKKTKYYRLVVVAIFLVAVYSCNTGKHFERDATITEGLYGEIPDGESNLSEEKWQNLFNDPILDSLIAEGLRNNPGIQVAIQRVRAAEASFNQSSAALAPTLSAQGGYTYARNSQSLNSNAAKEYDASSVKLLSSWEIDIWGKLNSAKKAAYANYLATDAAQKAVQTRLIANIASIYYTLLALDSKLLITKESVKNNIDLVETMKLLKDHGNVTGAAVVQSEATRYATEATIPEIEQQIRETENSLCLLLGRTPGKIERGILDDQKVHEMLATGVPSELLDNRPDVMQAEYNVINAFELTNSARAYFYPSVTLTANAGFDALDFKDLFDPVSFAGNFVGGLVQPIFNKRTNKTRLEIAQAQQEESLINFRNTLLNAGSEVSNALSLYNTSSAKIDIRGKQLEALVKSVDYTKELLVYGSATYTEVLIAQQSLLNAQLNNVNDHVQQLNAVVSLYRALGGGWK